MVLVLLPRARVADREKLRSYGRTGLISREKVRRGPDTSPGARVWTSAIPSACKTLAIK